AKILVEPVGPMRRHLHIWTLLLVDIFLVGLATVLAIALRDNFEVSHLRFATLTPYLLASVAAATVLLPLAGANRTIWRFSTMLDYLALVVVAFFIVLLAVGGTFLVQRMDGLPRALPVIQFLLTSAMLVG